MWHCWFISHLGSFLFVTYFDGASAVWSKYSNWSYINLLHVIQFLVHQETFPFPRWGIDLFYFVYICIFFYLSVFRYLCIFRRFSSFHWNDFTCNFTLYKISCCFWCFIVAYGLTALDQIFWLLCCCIPCGFFHTCYVNILQIKKD